MGKTFSGVVRSARARRAFAHTSQKRTQAFFFAGARKYAQHAQAARTTPKNVSHHNLHYVK
jgi:hypothetical protein